ncbi:MAG: hypothetical protein AB1640_02005 [bacterium]
MKKMIRLGLPLLAAVTLAAVGVHGLVGFVEARNLAARSRQARLEVERADALADPLEAIERYKSIEPSAPEIELRILQRQWAVTLELLRQVRRMRHNPLLETDLAALYGRLRDHLEEMQDRSATLLAEGAGLSPEVAWRAYNLQGAAKLVSAYTVVETERNYKKVAAMLREAISHLKAAIEAVDKGPSSGLERSIPRWNMELLHAEQMVERFQLAETDVQRQLDLRDNLEAILPGQGGYAPGEPVDRKIRK